jgi:hypothetical protein
MDDNVKRPPPILLTQILLMIFALLWLSSLITNLVMIARSGSTLSPFRVVLGVSILSGFVFMLLVAFWGLAKRKLYGKWLGVVSLICLWLLVLYIQLRPPNGPLKRYEFSSSGELAGAAISVVVISGLFLTLIFSLMFSKAVNAFFKRNVSAGSAFSPPAA